MSPHDVYNVLALLLQGQNSGVQLLKFSIEASDADSDAEQEILDPQITGSELSDPFIQPPAIRTAESLPLPSVPAPNTVIDPLPQSSLPCSESIIQIAIENVAEAGYLGRTGMDTSNQHLKKASQRSGTADTSNSNSKKRNREEIEQGGQTKKDRKKLVVPTREQSSRYTASSAFFILYLYFLIASKIPITRTSTSLFAPVKF